MEQTELSSVSSAAVQSVLRILRANIGVLRVMFHEAGRIVMNPSVDDIFGDLCQRWDLTVDEKRALRELLMLTRPAGGRNVAEFSSLLRILRRPVCGAAMVVASAPTTPKIAQPPVFRDAEKELRAHLHKFCFYLGSAAVREKSLTLAQFTKALRDFDGRINPSEARFYFQIAAAASSSSNGSDRALPIEDLVKACHAHMTLARHKAQNSELVREALHWTNEGAIEGDVVAPVEHCIPQPPTRVVASDDGRAKHAGQPWSRTTRSTLLHSAARRTVEQHRLELADESKKFSQWSPRRLAGRNGESPSPRPLRRPHLTPTK